MQIEIKKEGTVLLPNKKPFSHAFLDPQHEGNEHNPNQQRSFVVYDSYRFLFLSENGAKI